MTKIYDGSSSLYIFILLLLNTYKDLFLTYKILKQTESCDKLKEEVELKFKANSPKKPPRIFEHDDILLLKEPIYDEVYDAKVSNSLEELSVSEESIYAEVYDLHKRSTENLSLKDSGYSSISGEPIYEDVDDFSEQKKPTSLNHKEQPEPIYAKVDLSKKRSERQAKHIKDNSGTYHGLVKDKVNNLQVKLNEQSTNKPASQQIKTKAGFNVKEIRQKGTFKKVCQAAFLVQLNFQSIWKENIKLRHS